MAENAPFLPGLSPVSGKPVYLAFDGGRLTSDAGVLVLAEIERKLQIAERLAGCIADPRAPERVRHSFAEMIRYRALLIAAGYEDANDCDALRDDPAFKMAVGRLPETGAELCSQPTMSRLENLPTKTTLIRMMDAPRRPPGRLRFADRIDRLLTIDGRPLLRQRRSGAAAHPARHRRHARPGAWRPAAVAVPRPPRQPLLPPDAHLRGNDRQARGGDPQARQDARRCRGRPRPQASGRGDPPSLAEGGDRDPWRQPLRPPGSHDPPRPAGRVPFRDRIEGLLAFDGIERNRVRYIFGLAGNRVLLDRVAALAEDAAVRRAEEDADKIRNFHDFRYAAKSWTGERRVIARIEATMKGSDTRFVVTNLSGTPRWLYEVLYCGRGQAENLIKAHKLHLASDRTSCTKATANQFRLLIHTAAYWLLHTLKGLAPKTSFWRDAQFDTIRLAFIKIAARVTELVTRIKVSLPSSYPHKQSLARFAGRAQALPP